MRVLPGPRLCLASLLAAALALPAGAGAQAGGAVRLKVTDERGAPLGGAAVQVDGRPRAWTDSAGRAEVAGLAPGWYAFKLTRLDYRGAAPGVLVAPGRATVLEVTLEREPLALPGVAGKQKLAGPGGVPGPGPLGRRIPRAVIAATAPARLTDLLEKAPEVVLVQGPHGAEVRFRRALAGVRPDPPDGGPAPPDCVPAYYVDGVLHPGVGSPDVFPPGEVEEVLLFAGNVPAAYNGGRASCGVVALWTRGGAGAPSKPAAAGPARPAGAGKSAAVAAAPGGRSPAGP